MARDRLRAAEDRLRGRTWILALELTVLISARSAGGQAFSEPTSSRSTESASGVRGSEQSLEEAGESADAATVPARAPERRFEITAMGGYRIEGDLTTKSGAPYSHTSFDDAPTFGIALDYALGSIVDAEVQYSYASLTGTAFAVDHGTPNLEVEMRTSDILFSLLYSFPTSSGRLRPFLGIGVGFTSRDQGPQLGTSTRWSMSFSGGLRAYLSDRFGLRFQARWIPAYLYDLPGGYWYCPGGICVWSSNSKFLQQFDFQGGVIFRF
jgi:hypothetical protein